MQREYKQFLAICLSALFVLTACAGLQPQVAVNPEQGEKVVTMQASSFKFEPNNIKANQGDTIVLRIENVSDTGHDFTIKDPQGRKIQSVDIPPKKTVEVRVSLSESGEYGFYCDEPFHALLGMKGRIQAVKR